MDANVHQRKVTLRGARSPVLRRLRVPGTICTVSTFSLLAYACGVCASNPTVGPASPVASTAAESDPASSTASEREETAVASYQNPILPGTNPDPSACRVGEDYYLVTSSFEYFPGVPIHHSRDLVHWRPIGHVLTRETQLDLAGVKSSMGIFAPTLRYHDGTFYVVTTNMDGGGSFYVTATDPAGPWSDPVWVRESVFTMDPSLLFDDDGRVYYTRHGDERRGAIYQAEIDIATGILSAEPRKIWGGTGGIWPEGPHLYKVDGTYYLMISEGGTSYEHRVTVARSSSPWGPFAVNPKNPILTHVDLPKHPIQATGHAELLDTSDGHWWMVLLGIRPSTPRHHHIGRETFLAPVTWSRTGWPVVNGGRPIEIEMPGAGLPPLQPWPERPPRNDFDDEKLGFEWNYVRNPEPQNYTLTERKGYLRLKGTKASLRDVASPTLVLVRQRHHRVTFSTEVEIQADVGQRAGLVLRGNEDNHFTLLVEGTRAAGGLSRSVVLTMRIAGRSVEVGRQPVLDGPVVLSIEGYPDRYEFFFFQGDGPRQPLGTLPTTPFSYEETKSFTGAFVGMYAQSDRAKEPAVADFAWFEARPR
ncbi:MAG: glycoside hydrolase family 43 protein [Polyangiaceae bacterium]|nr:glycoside hydrolase family 43 protein [Polyangiaceae bacterium]